MKAPAKLSLVASAEQPLTPQQLKFNQLVRQIEVARGELLAWQEHLPAFAQAHGELVRPLQAEFAACQSEMAHKLDSLLAGPGWTQAQRTTMRQVLCGVAALLIDSDDIDAAQVDVLKALHDKHAETDFDTENREAVATMKGLLESITGFDLGDESLDTERGLFDRAQQRLRAQAQQEAERAQARRPARPSAAARRREAEAEQATQSMRGVYRKLASALHPDRVPEGPERVRATALMQRVNQAYDGKDLLTLFSLQLEIEQVDVAHLARATAARAQQYNRVLADQLAELHARIQAHQADFCNDYGGGGFLRPNPHKLGAVLEREASEMRALIAEARHDLRRLDEPAAAKRWLARMRREQASIDRGPPFDFPF